ncbi:MAG: hypothetical protein HY747_12305 [Elusimicrobia bacterium]|nr:hypothetical protein [Elusimicrobiota bacterium]
MKKILFVGLTAAIAAASAGMLSALESVIPITGDGYAMIRVHGITVGIRSVADCQIRLQDWTASIAAPAGIIYMPNQAHGKKSKKHSRNYELSRKP